jgi:type I site-specific restriction-modification system R (restriction) subunit
VDTDDRAFKDPDHPFRVAIVCAMWLTGFDVECLSTLYIDKPMRAHNLMQAIARANRVYPGKVCGVIVDYNGVLRSLREALAQYASGDGDDREDEGGDGGGEGGTDGGDETERLTVDLSAIDFERLRDEFARKVTRKRAAVQDIRDLIEQKLASMVARNPLRVDFYAKYQEIVAAYNREKDRATVEETFVQLVGFAATLDAEQRRAAEEGLSESELALFDLLFKETISKSDRERLKQASRSLLVSLRELLRPMHDWTQNAATQAEVKVFILDRLWAALPRPPFTDADMDAVAGRVYEYVWQRGMSGAHHCSIRGGRGCCAVRSTR